MPGNLRYSKKSHCLSEASLRFFRMVLADFRHLEFLAPETAQKTIIFSGASTFKKETTNHGKTEILHHHRHRLHIRQTHIGNTYEVVLADAIARYKRQQGYDVFFQTGTDEHGQKIELKAEEAGITPKEFVDNVSGEIKRIWDLMNTSYDKFIRTTDEDHEKQVKKKSSKM